MISWVGTRALILVRVCMVEEYGDNPRWALAAATDDIPYRQEVWSVMIEPERAAVESIGLPWRNPLQGKPCGRRMADIHARASGMPTSCIN